MADTKQFFGMLAAVGEDVAAWWNGSRMQDLRRGLDRRGEQQAFPRGNLRRETSAMLLTLTLH